jgi:hypothetical protein
LLERDYSYREWGAVHLLAVDAFALQHPESQSDHSVAFHLLRLCALLEHGADPRMGSPNPRGLESHLGRDRENLPHLAPPSDPGPWNVARVAEAPNPEEHGRAVRAWAEAVWHAWRDHHAWARETLEVL